VTRPADWSPLAGGDPVPGDPGEVALLGGRLQQTAAQIEADVEWLRSLCGDEFWDSDAGRAFHGKVDQAASRLWQAHYRYLQAGQALGRNLNGPGYAASLQDAQSLSLRALEQGHQAWAMMRQSLTTVLAGNKGLAPFEGQVPAPYPSQPLLDGSGNPVPMTSLSGVKPEVSAAIGRYNACASDLRTANGLLRQAVQLRDEAASAAAAKILGAIAADGLQDPTGLLAGLESAWGDAAGWVDHNWARVAADIANVCGWLATGLGLLALVFAFIPLLQPLAAVLEGMALTLTEIATVCHVILAATGNGPWAALGLDLLSVATFGIGRSAIRGAQVTVRMAEDVSAAGMLAKAGSLAEGLAHVGEVPDVGEVFAHAGRAEADAIVEAAGKAGTHLPGLLGRFGKDALGDLKPMDPREFAKTFSAPDWQAAFEEGVARTLGKAAGQAVHFTSPEITESLHALAGVPGIGQVTRLSGIQFSANVIHYSRLFTGTQITAIGTDMLDKLNSVLACFGSQIPGYSQLIEDTAT
jgi:hypothetical protein